MKILVTDGNSITGKTVISELVRLGVEVYGLVPDDVSTYDIEELGARSLIGDIRDKFILEKGIRAVDRIYHICPPWLLDEVEIANKIIKIAQDCEISLIGYHSIITPHIEGVPSHWNKMQVQMLLMKSNLPFTVIQPAMCMQNFLDSMIEETENIRFELPYKPDVKISWVDIKNVGEAVASLLTKSFHLGGTYELCGTDVPISCINIVKELTSLSFKNINFTNLPIKKTEKDSFLKKYNPQQVNNLKLYYNFINKGGMRAGNSKVLSMLLRKPPNSFSRVFDRIYQPS
jgi:uncharacterized protein YbjT (DUF2867 family)